jgi:SAM-dependent methyltransferase
MSDPDWRALNRANWDERVAIHLNAPNAYDLTPLRGRTARLGPIADAVLGPVDSLHVLHLQCHFGVDTLTMAQRGATVVGLDFSAAAIAAARTLTDELGLTDRARFVEADLYDAASALPEPACFDRVFVSWGALCWLPDMVGWARIVAHFLKPGGYLALAEAHPFAYVFDGSKPTADGMPGWSDPYFARRPMAFDNAQDYADPNAVLTNTRTVEWLHPISDVITALLDAGLRLDRLQEHDSVPWKLYDPLIEDAAGGFRWPDRPWLPLSYSLRAGKPDG